MTAPNGWYRASDGLWYYAGDNRPHTAPPVPDGRGGWHPPVPYAAAPPPPPAAWGMPAPGVAQASPPVLAWMGKHKVVTGLAALLLLGAIGSAFGGDSAPEAAPVRQEAPVVRTTTEPPREPAPTTAAPTTPAARRTTPAPVRLVPTVKPTTRKPAPVRTTVAPALDPHFGTCREANDAGYGDYVDGVDPEYDWYTDRDHDGVVCER